MVAAQAGGGGGGGGGARIFSTPTAAPVRARRRRCRRSLRSLPASARSLSLYRPRTAHKQRQHTTDKTTHSTVADGTCSFPTNFFGCESAAGGVTKGVKFLAEDKAIECEVRICVLRIACVRVCGGRCVLREGGVHVTAACRRRGWLASKSKELSPALCSHHPSPPTRNRNKNTNTNRARRPASARRRST